MWNWYAPLTQESEGPQRDSQKPLVSSYSRAFLISAFPVPTVFPAAGVVRVNRELVGTQEYLFYYFPLPNDDDCDDDGSEASTGMDKNPSFGMLG